MRTIPAVTWFTRTLGAHSTAVVWVKLTSPALAAPYAAVWGVGRWPLTLPMLTIEPPVSCSCIQWFARCEQKIAANRLRAMMRSVKRGVAVVESAGGAPPALFTSTSSRPRRSTTWSTIAHAASPSRRSTPNHDQPSGSASSGSRREQTATPAPASANRCAIPRPTPLVPPVTSTT